MSIGALNEQLAVVATIDPDAYGTGTQNSDYINMENFRRVLFIVQAGTLGTSGTLDFEVHEAKDSSGTDEQLLTGKSITQLTQAGTDSDKQVLVEVRADELSKGYTHLRGRLIIGTAGSDAAVLALGANARYGPASDFDLASVDEIVA